MKSMLRIFASAGLGILLVSGTALAQGQPPGSPDRVQGQVVRIDQQSGKVTLRADDGKTVEFQASADTLKDLKVGDRIEARLRK